MVHLQRFTLKSEPYFGTIYTGSNMLRVEWNLFPR